MVKLKKLLQSELNKRILSFYHENPSTVDTSRSIANWLDYERKEVKKALDALVKQKILIAHRIGSSIAYAYTQEKKVIRQIEHALKKRCRRRGNV